jgi:hypothetical protein
VNLCRADLSILKVIGCRQMLCFAANPATDVWGCNPEATWNILKTGG